MRVHQIVCLILLSILIFSSQASADTVKVIALFTDKALLQVGDKQKIVKKGETFEGVLLKSASGRGAIVEIDGNTVNLKLNQSMAGGYKKPDRIGTKIYPDSLGMFYVRGLINGESTNFLVDTGASFVTISGKKARSLGIDFHQGLRSTAQTAAAVVPVWQIKLDSVNVGGIVVRNVDATVIEGNQPAEVLLGNSFLSHTHIQKAGSALEINQRF